MVAAPDGESVGATRLKDKRRGCRAHWDEALPMLPEVARNRRATATAGSKPGRIRADLETEGPQLVLHGPRRSTRLDLPDDIMSPSQLDALDGRGVLAQRLNIDDEGVAHPEQPQGRARRAVNAEGRCDEKADQEAGKHQAASHDVHITVGSGPLGTLRHPVGTPGEGAY